MKQKTIVALKELFEKGKVTEDDILSLEQDQRKGVQRLLQTYHKKVQQEKMLEQLFERMSQHEQQLYEKGYRLIAGVDEAGRGPLAGPVVAAAVILPPQFKLLGLNDSKQLTEETRETYYDVIKEQAVSYGIAMIQNDTIDHINIYESTKEAMIDAIGQLDPKPEHVLIDAVKLEHPPYSTNVLVKGDQKSISIAAASILAKVTRDRFMKEVHHTYPEYRFNTHMGYGTSLHIEMLKKHGPSPIHRQSFAPVRKMMNE